MQIIMTTAEAVSSKNYIARLMNESARIAQVMGKEEEAQMYIKAAADFIGGKEQDFDGEGIMSITYNDTHVTIDVTEEVVMPLTNIWQMLALLVVILLLQYCQQ